MELLLPCLLDTPLLTIYHDAPNRWLYNQWKGQHDSQTVYSCGRQILACLQATPCPKMLSDHTLLTGNWEAAAPRLSQGNMQQLATQGVGFFAWVRGASYHDLVAMQLVQKLMEQPTIAIFDDVAAAYTWLQQRP